MSDNYPDHLNPFINDLNPDSKHKIANSFRRFKKTLRNSFRLKTKTDSSDVTLRNSNAVERYTASYVPPTSGYALPRSRFHERTTISLSQNGLNPFDDEETVPRFKRKGKKRAPPPPPTSLSTQNLSSSLSVSTGNSEWSLNSSYSESRDFDVIGNERTFVNEFVDFNKNMECLKDDSNNNIVVNKIHEDKETGQIPDLVVSCPSSQIQSDDKREEKDYPILDETSNCENRIDQKEFSNVNIQEPDAQSIDLLYNERKSLYLTGSKDELNTYVETSSLYITDSKSNLDDQSNVENNNNNVIPIPKQRKNKLSKDTLLGI